MTALGIVGGGAWGTSLAVRFGQKHPIKLWVREEETVHNIMTYQENRVFLPNVPIPKTVSASCHMDVLAKNSIVLLAVPSQHMRTILKKLVPFLQPNTVLVVCSKGLEPNTSKFMSEVVSEVTQGAKNVAVLSGPSFAHEVDSPISLTFAHTPGTNFLDVAGCNIRLYRTDDLVGAQIGGVMKNVFAIGCGILRGRGLGESAQAAFIARGFEEMKFFGKILGAQEETLCGPAGLRRPHFDMQLFSLP